ncbi:hypothetical protein JOQ06_029659, partial [Pogonophryne albipinna]
MDKRKTRPGGAEKLRLKKLKSLEVEAAKYSKLTDIFGAGVTTPASAAASGDERVEAYMPRQVQGKSSWSVQRESQTNSGSPKTAPPEREKATAGLDILSAHRMVASTQDTLKSFGRDFEYVKKAADTFVNWTNTEIQERDDTDIEVEATLPQKRRRRMKKVLPGEMTQDETLDDADKSYELCTSALPQSALQDLSKCLQVFDSRATKENMQAELKSFALQWNRLKASPLAEYKARTVEDGSGGEEDNTAE